MPKRKAMPLSKCPITSTYQRIESLQAKGLISLIRRLHFSHTHTLREGMLWHPISNQIHPNFAMWQEDLNLNIDHLIRKEE